MKINTLWSKLEVNIKLGMREIFTFYHLKRIYLEKDE